MHSVYILRSKKDHTLYIGYSTDIENRLKQHNSGSVASTKNKRPLELIYTESFIDKRDAMQREKYFKTGWGRTHIKKMLNHTLQK